MPLPAETVLHYVDNIDTAMEMKRWLGERRSVLGLDTETTGLNPYASGSKIRLIQIGDTHTGWAIPTEGWLGAALEVLNLWDGPIALHNASFDVKWFKEHTNWKIPWDRIHDTMIMAKIARPGKPATLKGLSKELIDRNADAGQAALDTAMKLNNWDWATVPVDLESYWVYSALDPILTSHLWEHFNSDSLNKSVFDLEMAVLRITTEMEINGSRIDTEYSTRKENELQEYALRNHDWAKQNWGINLASPGAVAKFFTEKLNVPITRRTPSGNVSVDASVLEELSAHPRDDVRAVATFILNTKKASKFASAYFRNFNTLSTDGLLHPNINTIEAVTGRMSISSPALQQVPRGDASVRNAFIPRNEGESIISVDYSQIEMRLLAHFSQDPHLIQAFIDADSTGGDFFTILGSTIYSDPNFSKKDSRRGLVKNCVPLDSEILTKRGWLHWDEVSEGDYTPGFNLETGKTEWTRVNSVHVSENADVYELGTPATTVRGTFDHRWVVDSGRNNRQKKYSIVHAHQIPGTEKRVILGSVMEDGSSDITPHEARLLGWILGDGDIKRSDFVGAPSQSKNGMRVKCEVTISQTNPVRIEEIKELLSDIPYRCCVSKKTGQHVWHLNSEFSRELLRRADIDTKRNFDAWKLAASLSHESRVSMLDALNAANGTQSNLMRICQETGTPVEQLVIALMYFTGSKPQVHIRKPGHGWQKKDVSYICARAARFTGQRAKFERVSTETVWCVSTDLGTWTMRQDGKTPMITGNTLYGSAYGASPKKMAQSAGIPLEVMQPIANDVFRTYPGIKQFQRDTIALGEQRAREEGTPYILTAGGRRIPCRSGEEYKLTNYTLQGSAGEILKQALVRLDNADLTPYLMLPIHDEVVCSVPTEDAKDFIHEIQEIMTVNDGWALPLLADGEGPYYRWGEKYEK